MSIRDGADVLHGVFVAGESGASRSALLIGGEQWILSMTDQGATR